MAVLIDIGSIEGSMVSTSFMCRSGLRTSDSSIYLWCNISAIRYRSRLRPVAEDRREAARRAARRTGVGVRIRASAGYGPRPYFTTAVRSRA